MQIHRLLHWLLAFHGCICGMQQANKDANDPGGAKRVFYSFFFVPKKKKIYLIIEGRPETSKSAYLEYHTWHFMDMYVVCCKQIRMQMTWVGLKRESLSCFLCAKIRGGFYWRHETCKGANLEYHTSLSADYLQIPLIANPSWSCVLANASCTFYCIFLELIYNDLEGSIGNTCAKCRIRGCHISLILFYVETQVLSPC